MVFLDVSKAFDKVWHAGLLHKLKCLGVEGNLLNWLEDYLLERKIRVIINGQSSEWKDTNAGVPQGSILGPLLFLVFINDIVSNIERDIHLFADDTSLMDIIDDYLVSYAKLNRDLAKLSTWASDWLVTFNATKTVYLQITRKNNPYPKPILYLDGVQIVEVKTHKHLGLTFNSHLTWSDHITQLVSKASKCVGLLKRISRDVPRKCLEILYKSTILPIMEYAAVIFDGSADTITKRLEDTQRQAALACTGAYKHTKHIKLLEELGWPLLSTRRKHHRLVLMYKLQHNMAPHYLSDSCPLLTRERTNYDLRTGMNITQPPTKTTTYQNSFFPKTIKDWNNLNNVTRTSISISSFKEKLKKSLKLKSNPLFYLYSTRAATHQTRIRLGLSGLSSQRCDYNHIKDPRCPSCHAKLEDPQHFFLLCPTFDGPRLNLIQGVVNILIANNTDIDFRRRQFRELFIHILLNGHPSLDEESNKTIFELCQTFIRESQRFS
jgi:hypothetical protein